MNQSSIWIACDSACEAPLIVRPFSVSEPVSGKIQITGLGFFALFVNGRPVSDDCLTPVLSDYGPRELRELTYPLNDRFFHRIYYREYDLSPFLQNGENRLEILLGNGWYRQRERIAEGDLSFGDQLRARFEASILCRSGEQVLICSDGSETFVPSHILKSNLFIGETQDFRRLAMPGEPSPVTPLPGDSVPLYLQTCPPDRVIRAITPRFLRVTERGTTIYDAMENITGWVRLRLDGRAGDTVTIRFAENLGPDGELDFTSAGSDYIGRSGQRQIQSDTFISDGQSRICRPRFVWHGFRYFEVEGRVKEPVVEVVHAAVRNVSYFQSDNAALNFLYDAYIRTQLGNMHTGFPSDCPHRERLGYTGDGQVTAESAMLLLDSRSFYEKWIEDILDCQDRVSGHVQHTAPFLGGGGGPGGWGSAIVMVPYAFYRRFDDLSLLSRCYPSMRKWVDYMRAHSDGGLVTREEEGGWCLGDWAAPGENKLPPPFVNTCYFVKALLLLEKVASLLHKPKDARNYLLEAEKAKQAILDRYYSILTGSFCGGIQGADAFALDIGLYDSRTIWNLVAYYRELGQFDTGFLGTPILLDVLFRYGQTDLAFSLMTGSGACSYMTMKNAGATTLWENWDGSGSHNHPMFGAPVYLLFRYILGMRQMENACAYRDIVIAPVFPERLRRAAGTITTDRGELSVSRLRNGHAVTVEIVLPPETNAVFAHGKVSFPLHAGRQQLQLNLLSSRIQSR